MTDNDARTKLIDELASQAGVPALSNEECEAILALAAVAAHGTGDRTSAPLASYIAGLAAAKAPDRRQSLDDIRRQAAAIVPAPGDG